MVTRIHCTLSSKTTSTAIPVPTLVQTARLRSLVKQNLTHD